MGFTFCSVRKAGGEKMVWFPQGGWDGAAEVGIREGCPGLRTAHLLQPKLGTVTEAVGSYKSQLHKIQQLSAAAEIPRVTRAESEIPTLPFLSLVLPQTCISHLPFLARKGFACTENCITLCNTELQPRQTPAQSLFWCTPCANSQH